MSKVLLPVSKKCFLWFHKWTNWEPVWGLEIGTHFLISRECVKCGKIQQKWVPIIP